MNTDTAKRLIELNRQFYQSFASAFSQTRQKLQPGVKKIITDIEPEKDILDFGCGNGELWRVLAQSGHRGRYIGIDFSLPLLRTALSSGDENTIIEQPTSSKRIETVLQENQACFLEADLTVPGWEEALGMRKFGVILAFASLHHIPGEINRKSLLQIVHKLLLEDGLFILSVWQFLQSARLSRRIQPWEKVGLNQALVDPADYLLDWRHAGYGLRYVHHFSEETLSRLAIMNNFKVKHGFYSDGEGSKLSLYQIWEKQG